MTSTLKLTDFMLTSFLITTVIVNVPVCDMLRWSSWRHVPFSSGVNNVQAWGSTGSTFRLEQISKGALKSRNLVWSIVCTHKDKRLSILVCVTRKLCSNADKTRRMNKTRTSRCMRCSPSENSPRPSVVHQGSTRTSPGLNKTRGNLGQFRFTFPGVETMNIRICAQDVSTQFVPFMVMYCFETPLFLKIFPPPVSFTEQLASDVTPTYWKSTALSNCSLLRGVEVTFTVLELSMCHAYDALTIVILSEIFAMRKIGIPLAKTFPFCSNAGSV